MLPRLWLQLQHTLNILCNLNANKRNQPIIGHYPLNTDQLESNSPQLFCFCLVCLRITPPRMRACLNYHQGNSVSSLLQHFRARVISRVTHHRALTILGDNCYTRLNIYYFNYLDYCCNDERSLLIFAAAYFCSISLLLSKVCESLLLI